MSRRKGRKGCAEGDEDFLDFFYFFVTIKVLSAWGNNLPAERAEMAERTSRGSVTIISAISFISAGQ